MLTAIACSVHLSHYIFRLIIFFKKALRNDFVEFWHLQVLVFLSACPDHLWCSGHCCVWQSYTIHKLEHANSFHCCLLLPFCILIKTIADKYDAALLIKAGKDASSLKLHVHQLNTCSTAPYMSIVLLSLLVWWCTCAPSCCIPLLHLRLWVTLQSISSSCALLPLIYCICTTLCDVSYFLCFLVDADYKMCSCRRWCSRKDLLTDLLHNQQVPLRICAYGKDDQYRLSHAK